MVKISKILNRVWTAGWTPLPYSNNLRYEKIPLENHLQGALEMSKVISTDDLSKKLSINFHLVERMD
jgi:hypothetical protein